MSRPRKNGGGLIIAIIGVILLIALLESLLEIIIPLQSLVVLDMVFIILRPSNHVLKRLILSNACKI